MTSVEEIERALAELRAEGDGAPAMRTTVLTHVAWLPAEWEEAAEQVLEGLAERHPSRTILLRPDPAARHEGLEADVARQCFALAERHVCAEVIRIRLCGRTAHAPASVLLPLVLPDLPVFLRWRGQPAFGAPEYEELTRVADRLIVDSSEWPELRYDLLAGSFDRVAVSDLAWRRTLGWRARIAALWPGVAETRQLTVRGPLAEALLLAGWLRSRLERDIALAHEPAPRVEAVAIEGASVESPREPEPTPSDLLSAELDVFGRDPVYEQAVAGHLQTVAR
jgi:glucose-6-phosphate dehydrogenase assembly protein OpcA